MQNKKNSKIISKLVLSTTAAFMATMAVKAAEEPNDVQSQVENFQQEDQLQVAYAKFSSVYDDTQVEGSKDTTDTTAVDTGVVYNKTACNVEGYTDAIVSNVKIASSITVDDSGSAVSVTAIAGETNEGDQTGAFSGCDKLVSVDIPSTVTNIGQNAFYDCKNLKYIQIGNKDITLDNSIVSGSTDVKIVYVATGTSDDKIAEIKTATGATEVRIIETSLVSPGSASGKIESVAATDNSITIKWGHVSDTEMYAISRKIGSGASSTIGVYHVPAGTEAGTVLEFVDKNEDKKVEFGKGCTYTVTPYNLHDEYKNITLENFKTYSNDPFGMKTNTGDSQEFTYDEFKKNNVTSHYTKVTDGNGGTREGSYANIVSGKNHAVYSLNGNCYGITQNGEFDWGNVENASSIVEGTDGNVALYVREWDMTKDSEKTAFEYEWGGDTQERVARVFSLQVVGDLGTDGVMIEKTNDICANGVSNEKIPMYIELDNTWNTNGLTVKAIREEQNDETLSHEIVTNPVGFPAGKYIKVMLDEFNYGPYAIYADKLENAGSGTENAVCDVCGKEDCTCGDKCECTEKDCKCDETKTDENNKDTSGTNGTSSSSSSSGKSSGYATGDVASAGLLQSAFGMLAAAGSTLMGLFRKKKDRE